VQHTSRGGRESGLLLRREKRGNVLSMSRIKKVIIEFRKVKKKLVFFWWGKGERTRILSEGEGSLSEQKREVLPRRQKKEKKGERGLPLPSSLRGWAYEKGTEFTKDRRAATLCQRGQKGNVRRYFKGKRKKRKVLGNEKKTFGTCTRARPGWMRRRERTDDVLLVEQDQTHRLQKEGEMLA